MLNTVIQITTININSQYLPFCCWLKQHDLPYMLNTVIQITTTNININSQYEPFCCWLKQRRPGGMFSSTLSASSMMLGSVEKRNFSLSSRSTFFRNFSMPYQRYD